MIFEVYLENNSVQNLVLLFLTLVVHCVCIITEKVLKQKEIIEDCNEEEEFCTTTNSKMDVPVDQIVCQRSSTKLNCTTKNQTSDNKVEKSEICYPNSVGFCSRTPKMATITMKKQPCGDDLKITTSKICITHPNGQWSCQNLTNDKCQDTNVTKIISTEATQSGLECTEKKLPPICFDPKRCQLVKDDFQCVQDVISTSIDLEETICDKCVHGRKSVRPILETMHVCKTVPETICINTPTDISWKKWCRELNQVENEKLSVPAIIGV